MRQRGHTRVLPAMFAVALLTGALTGVTACGRESLATSCSEYLHKPEAEQLKLAAQWGSLSQTDKNNVMAEAIAPSYRDQLLQYCSQQDHASATLKELALTLGP